MRYGRVMAARAVAVVLLMAGAGVAAEDVRIVELKGDAAQIGMQHGKLMGEQIKTLHREYLRRCFGDEQRYKQGLAAAAGFGSRLLPEHAAELTALAQGAGMDGGEMLLANCFLDLLPNIACSTIALPAEASPDGVARLGRNLDFPAKGVADKASVLLIVRPQGRYAFANVTWPGVIGVLSGMNEHGLCVANMEISRVVRPPTAMPYILLYRMVLERCKTVDEAVELLKKTPRQSANNLMLMDAAGNRAVAEITPAGVVVRKGAAGAALISTNHQRGQDQASGGKCWRYDRLRTAAGDDFGKIDAAAVEKMLDTVSVQGLTIQSMVFEPAKRVMWLAVGSEATRRDYERIELGKLFANGER